METQTVIPEKYVNFCEQVAMLAREAGLSSVGMNFTPGFSSDWRYPVRLHWEAGRHGDASGRFIVTSEVIVRAEVRPNT